MPHRANPAAGRPAGTRARLARTWLPILLLGLALLPRAATAQPQPFPQDQQQLQQQQLDQLQQQRQRQLNDQAGPGRRNLNRQGQATQAEGGASAPAAIGQSQPRRLGNLVPFGSDLFENAVPASSEAPNPGYIIQPGDRVSVRVYGPTEVEASPVVDAQGNVFLPTIGPVHVGGARASDLQGLVSREVRNQGVYANNAQVYAVLLTSHRIGVFVTGPVRKPGRYAGAASDSVLDFLVRAGGIDPARGSYRRIAVQRRGKDLAVVDLYDFLQTGKLPQVLLQEGDTLVAAPQRGMVATDGSVRNEFLFEMSGRSFRGRELIELARPLPAATDVVVRGTRGRDPFTKYYSMREFENAELLDQDQATFVADAPAETLRVRVEGSRIGPSVVVVDRHIALLDVLNYIAVDPALADTGSVYLLRRSIAEQQKRSLDEALERLERSLFLAISTTTGESEIRASEAQLIASYIQRARRVQPEGRLVVSDEAGRIGDVRLQEDDVIVIPERSQVVLVAGEVMVPQAVLYRPDFTIEDYVQAAGGYSQRGAPGDFLLRRANGALITAQSAPIKPGDELVLLPHIDRKFFQIFKDFLAVIYQAAFSVAVFNN